jgi:predicted esterase
MTSSTFSTLRRIAYSTTLAFTCLSTPLSADANQTPYTDCVYIFAHGLGSNHTHVEPYRHFGIIPSFCTALSQDGPEVASGYHASALGQDGDIAVITKQIEQACQANPNCKIVGVGVSKGAATWVNTFGKLAREKSPYLKNIKALVIESSFTQAQDVAFSFVPTGFQSSCSSSMNSLISWQFPNFKSDGMHPITSIASWGAADKDTLIILVHSRKDQLIPFTHSEQLYKAIQQQGFKNVHLIEASAGEHGNVFWGPDGRAVRLQLWHLYKQYGLPIPVNPYAI